MVLWIILIVIVVAVINAVVFGYRGIAQQQERFLIERLGHFLKVVGPGPVFTVPFIEKVRAVVSVWTVQLPLFAGPEATKIDFTDGSAGLRGAMGFVKIIESQNVIEAKRSGVYKAIYSVDNWRTAATELLENALRSHLNSLKIEEGLEGGRAGYDLFTKMPPEEQDGMKKTLRGWGLELVKITVSDYDLDAVVISAREEVLKAATARLAAEDRVVQFALESGGRHGEIQKILVERYGYSAERADEIATSLVRYFEAARTGRLIDWRGGGAGEIASLIGQAVVAAQMAKETTEKSEDA